MSQAIDKIKLTINKLGFDHFDSIPKNINNLISKFEEEHYIIPPHYKYFLEHYGEGNFETDAHYRPIKNNPLMSSEGFQDISFFYGIGTEYDISRMLKIYIHRIPKNHIPIAELPGGNQLCLDVNRDDPNYGKVYIWDHENECDGGFDNVYQVADNFSDFIASFEKEEGKINKEDDSIVHSRFDF